MDIYVKAGDKVRCLRTDLTQYNVRVDEIYEVQDISKASFTLKGSNGLWTNPLNRFNAFELVSSVDKEVFVKQTKIILA